MRGVMRVATVAGISLLLMAVLFGCAQPVREEMQGAGIRITIVAPQAARAINVSEYEVIALAVELYDPWDDLVATITWEPWEGLQSYVVPLSRTGQYRIEVTHTAEADGDIVEVMEWTYFTIQAMRITEIEVVPGAVLQINVGGEGEEPAPQDGTLTVSFSGVPAPDGTHVPIGVFREGWDPAADLDWLEWLVAGGGGEVIGGAASDTVRDFMYDEAMHPDQPPDWIGEEGAIYLVYAWVDVNGNFEETMAPDAGDLVMTQPREVMIEGATFVHITGEEFELLSE